MFLQDMAGTTNESQLIALVQQYNVVRAETVDLLEELRSIVNEERDMAVSDAKESQQSTMLVLLISMVSAIVIGGTLVIWISRMVARNLNKVVAVSDQVALNNLAVEEIDYQGHDEIGKIAAATNLMTRNLKSMIRQISDISQTVSSQSEELTQSSNEVMQGAEQISSTMEELSSGAEVQANHANQLSDKMGQFSGKVKHSNETGEAVYAASREVSSLTAEGSGLMKSSVSQMNAIDQLVRESVNKVQGLDLQTKEVSNLILVIRDIAEQTNLLALNAAIEASRAGEQGRGFAVVAAEVRKLSEQVSKSVSEITGIVEGIQSESSAVVQSLQTGYSEVQKGSLQMQTTGETFAAISEAIQKMADQIQAITGNLSAIHLSTEEMNSTVQEIAAVSQQSAAGIEETSASAEQSSSTMQEVAASSDELAKLAEQLNQLVSKFKLK